MLIAVTYALRLKRIVFLYRHVLVLPKSGHRGLHERMFRNGVRYWLFLGLYYFITFPISRQQRRSNFLAQLIGHRRDIPPSLQRRLRYQRILFPWRRALDLRAAILPEQRFHFSSGGIKSFIVSPFSWYLNVESHGVTSAFTLTLGGSSRSLELLKFLNYPWPLATRRWEVRKARTNDNNIIWLYRRYLHSSREPWPHRSNASNPKVRFLISIFMVYLGLALSSRCSRRWISDIYILSLAIRQRCYAHLLLFECYLFIFSIGICWAFPYPDLRSSVVVLITRLFFILFLGSHLCDRRSCSVVCISTL